MSTAPKCGEPMDTEKRLIEYAKRIHLHDDDVLYLRALLHRAYQDGAASVRNQVLIEAVKLLHERQS